MKKHNLTRILVLVLSFALLIGSALVINAAAESTEPVDGSFGAISLAYKDTVAITVKVKATKAQIDNGEVVVNYNIRGQERKATFFEEAENGYVKVITDGIAAYNFAEIVTFSSTANNEQVESDRTYSVVEFLYKQLHYYDTASEDEKALYNAILEFGKAIQKVYAEHVATDINKATLVFTKNADVKIGEKKFAFAPGASVENVTPVWGGTVPVGQEIVGWNIVDNGEAKAVDTTFTASGVVEVVSPVFKALDPTPFTLANGGFENGLDGWTLVGNIGDVSPVTHYWANDPESAEGFAFGMDGGKMFSAYAEGASEGAVGTLTSSSFIVGGTGYVTFKLGAMKNGESVYLDVVDATTHQILVRYYNNLWAERTNDVKSGCTLVPYKANLSAFMGKSVYFRISDNATDDYGLFFADSFNTYHTTVPGDEFNTATPVTYQLPGTIYDLFNGGFEMGGLQGWKSIGEIGLVTNATGYWAGNISYGKDGDYLFTGVESFGADTMREGNTGTLTSSAFQLGGSGYITYMLGGGNDLCYVQVIDAVTGEVLGRYRQQAREDGVLKSYVADLSAHVGKTVRIQLVDNATSDWGCVSFDNVKTYYASKPEGFIDAVNVMTYEIVNGGFESGLDGWKQSGEIGWVLDAEVESEWYAKNDGVSADNKLFAFWHNNGTNNEWATGTLESSRFFLKNNTYVSFRFGGAGGTADNPNHDVRIELCNANGEVIATFYNDAEGKENTRMNAYYYQFTGVTTECFFRVCDYSGSNYGGVVIDDFRVNLEGAPEGFIPAIQ